MYKLLKWVYRLGVNHERRRIKLLIAEYRNYKPTRPITNNKQVQDDFFRQESIWYAVSEELNKLTEPSYIEEGASITKIDGDV